MGRRDQRSQTGEGRVGAWWDGGRDRAMVTVMVTVMVMEVVGGEWRDRGLRGWREEGRRGGEKLWRRGEKQGVEEEERRRRRGRSDGAERRVQRR